MSERAAMKRRVRGLLHGSWLKPLLALVLALAPICALCVPIILLTKPSAPTDVLREILSRFAIDGSMFGDLQTMALVLLHALRNPQEIVAPLLGWLPMILALLAVFVFVAKPMAVGVFGYFKNFLRGKNPRVLDVFSSFSGRYPRALGGMAYAFMWGFIWLTVMILLPLALMLCSAVIASQFAELGQPQIQITVFAVLIVGGLIWLVVGLFVFLNRLLAYSLTPACIAEQPQLPAHRAVRLSRKLMKHAKWRLIGLMLSFLVYFLPAIFAGIAMPLLTLAAPSLGISEAVMGTIRIVLWVVIIVNQLAWLYVAPYMTACFHGFYIERKREALLDQDITQADLAGKPVSDEKSQKDRIQ